MPLNLIYGPPNSGRAGLVRQRFADALDRDPVLVVPTVDDVYAFERELCEDGATLGGAVMTFGGLFQAVLSAAGLPQRAELTHAQRMRAVSLAVTARRYNLGPLRNSTARPGFAAAFGHLLDELQETGLQPEAVEAAAQGPAGSAYLADLAALFTEYAKLRDRLGKADPQDNAREALALLRQSGGFWGDRPVFLYGLDDLTGNQFELLGALAAATEVTVTFPYEEGSLALAARATLLERLREIGVDSETRTEPDAANTSNPLLFHLERNFGAPEPERRKPGEGLILLCSAGARGEAEAIATEVAKLMANGVRPAEIAIALRDPERRGPLIASVLESYGIATALEAEIPVASTAVGGTLLALLEAELGDGGVGDLLRFLRGHSGETAQRVDWFEQGIRRRRVHGVDNALKLWQERYGRLPRDLMRVRRAASQPGRNLLAEVGGLAGTMASRQLPSEDGPPLGPTDELEMRAAGAVSAAMDELAELGPYAPRPHELTTTLQELRLRAWSGPVEDHVRIASPYRLRAARFDHVFVGSLQDGEFPRRDGREDPFLAEAQRTALGLRPRRDNDAEERYIFHACLALPRQSLWLSCRDSDENGVAESPSPLLDDVRRLLDPPPSEGAPDPVEGSIAHRRDLAQVVHRVGDAPSENELARAIAAHGPDANASEMLAAAGVEDGAAERLSKRLAAARATEAATRAPGPLSNPAVIEALSTVAAYGGTTLEGFDLCSYRWFVAHELDPQLIDPLPDPLIQGGVMHAVLDRLYRQRPGGDPLPRPGSLDLWLERGREVVEEVASERRLLGGHPTQRAIVRRVEGLLARFLTEEAERETGFEPWLLEARFGDEGSSARPALEVDSWRLHGAIDRVDSDGNGHALVIDYKLAAEVTPLNKLEEDAKLQLQLYLIAVAEHWGAEPIGGLYLPLRGTSARRPRGAVLDEAAGSLAPYGLSRTDLTDREGFEELLADARRRAAEIVTRMRRGDVRRDPGPRRGLRRHDVCPFFCEFAPICRRDRAPSSEGGNGQEEDA